MGERCLFDPHSLCHCKLLHTYVHLLTFIAIAIEKFPDWNFSMFFLVKSKRI